MRVHRETRPRHRRFVGVQIFLCLFQYAAALQALRRVKTVRIAEALRGGVIHTCGRGLRFMPIGLRA